MKLAAILRERNAASARNSGKFSLIAAPIMDHGALVGVSKP